MVISRNRTNSYAPIHSTDHTTTPSHHRQHSRKPLLRRLTRLPKLLTLLTLTLVLGLTILALITYLSPLRGATRPCLPFSLSGISTSAHRKLSCAAQSHSQQTGNANEDELDGTLGETTMAEGVTIDNAQSGGADARPELEAWLWKQKKAFLGDFGRGDLKGWTVVMGNEAGDLDSIASSVAYAYLSTRLESAKAIPLLLTPSNLMRLREENRVAFRMNQQMNIDALLHPDMIPVRSASETNGEPNGHANGTVDGAPAAAATTPTYPASLSILGQLGATYALVDHNRLLPLFGDGHVVGIIDHHEDEGAHTDAATRLIQVPTGSCSSLVVQHFKDKWIAANAAAAQGSAVNGDANGNDGATSGPIPIQVPSLLLQALIIDTQGVKPGGKATPTDTAAAEFLYPLSIFDRSASKPNGLAGQSDTGDSAPNAVLTEIFTVLSDAKSDVSQLDTKDLLVRDYKEYELPTSSSIYPVIRAGLSTVPVGFKAWLERETDWTSLMAGVDGYMADRKLDIEGILTSYNNKEGKHRRELLLTVGTTGKLSAGDAQRFLTQLASGLEGSVELELAPWEKGGAGVVKKLILGKRVELNDEAQGRWAKVWKQKNSKATRKQVAPLLRDAVARFE